MITIDSKINKQIAKTFHLKVCMLREQQIQILHAINNEKEITNELIRKIAFK